MEAISMDLRCRVAEALDEGVESRKQIADRFSVTERWIYQFQNLRNETGGIAPRPHGGGRKRAITDKQMEKITQRLEAKPDATLDELRRHCRTSGSIMAVHRSLARAGITRKKSR